MSPTVPREPVIPTVLIVDDNPIVLELCSAGLQAAGFTVLTLKSADGVITLARSRNLAVVLLDVRMPGMGGEELAHMLKDDTTFPPDMLVVLHSEVSEDALRALTQRAGADSYFQKSEDTEALAEHLWTLIRQHHKELVKQADRYVEAVELAPEDMWARRKLIGLLRRLGEN